MQRSIDAQGVTLPVLISVAYACGILTGPLLGDDDAVRETAEAVRIGEEGGDDVVLEVARVAQGLVLSRRATAAECDVALELLHRARDALVGQRNLFTAGGYPDRASLGQQRAMAITGLRGTHEMGRGDAMTTVGPMSYPGVPK